MSFSKIITTLSLCIAIVSITSGCSSNSTSTSEQASSTKNKDVAAQKSKPAKKQDKSNVRKKSFKLVNLKRDKDPTIPKVEFSAKPKNGACTFELNAKPFRPMSHSALKKEGLPPQISPVQILEKGKALKVDLKKKGYGDKCIGSMYSTNEFITYSPSSKDVKPTDLALALDKSIPMESSAGAVYWVFPSDAIAGKIRRVKIGTDENIELYVKIRHYGKIKREAVIFINDVQHKFTATDGGFLEAKISLKNSADAVKFRIRGFNYMRVDELSFVAKTEKVSVISPLKK